MDLVSYLYVILANLVPSTEQMGAIFLGLSLHLSPLEVLLISVTVNSLLFFPIFFVLKVFYDKFLSRIRIFNRYLERVRKKGQPYVEKYGVVGITLFISLPSPFTGTYTATILCWLLGLDWKKSFLSIFLGSLIGGIIILAVYYLIVFGIIKNIFGFTI